MLVFICSLTVWASAGHGWIEFAGFWTFVEVTIWLILHCADIIPQIAWNYMVVSKHSSIEVTDSQCLLYSSSSNLLKF